MPCIELPMTPFYMEETGCLAACPGSAKFYFTSDKVCIKKCPSGSFKATGSFACETAPDATLAEHSVSFSDTTYHYMYPRAVSYAAVDWNVGLVESSERASIFLNAEDQLMYLILRTTTEKQNVQYAPVVFLAAHAIISCQLQLTAKNVFDSAFLAIVLLRNVKIFGSYILEAFETPGSYIAAVRKCEHTVTTIQSVFDLDGEEAVKSELV